MMKIIIIINNNEITKSNEFYRIFLSASISCIISVPNIPTKSPACEISVLDSPSTESYLNFTLLLIV